MKTEIRKIFLFRFFDELILVYPVYSLLFVENGISALEVSLLLVIWSVVSIVLEVPLGVVADKYSRKKILIASQIIRSVGYLFWLFGGSFWNYAIGFVLWGIKGAMFSGTFEAFVYDKLDENSQEDKYEEIIGKIKSIALIGVILALVLGGVLAEWSYGLVLVLSIIAPLVSSAALLTVNDSRNIESTKEQKYFSLLKNLLSMMRPKTVLFSAIVAGSIIFGTYGAADEFLALIFSGFGLPETMIGLFIAFHLVGFVVAGVVSKYFPSSKKNNLWEALYVAVAAVFFVIPLLVSLATGEGWWLLMLIIISSFLLGVVGIKFETKIQDNIKSEQRATMLSINSLLYEVVTVVITIIFGGIAERWGFSYILLAVGVILFASGGLILLISFLRRLSNSLRIGTASN